MNQLNSEDFRQLGVEVAVEMVRSEDGANALINYKNWERARKQRFLQSMREVKN